MFGLLTARGKIFVKWEYGETTVANLKRLQALESRVEQIKSTRLTQLDALESNCDKLLAALTDFNARIEVDENYVM